MIDTLVNNGLIKSNEEGAALIRHNVQSFGNLIDASDAEPRLLKPVLNRYIEWFNANVVPKALAIVNA